MIASAKLKYIRVTPRKFRLIIPLVKGKSPEAAIAILAGVKKYAARYCEDLIKSALANAKRIQGLDVSTLHISKLTADGGPMLKRFRAASMGRAGAILKRTSHITLELDQIKQPAPKAEKTAGATKENVKVKSKKEKVKITSKK